MLRMRWIATELFRHDQNSYVGHHIVRGQGNVGTGRDRECEHQFSWRNFCYVFRIIFVYFKYPDRWVLSVAEFCLTFECLCSHAETPLTIWPCGWLLCFTRVIICYVIALISCTLDGIDLQISQIVFCLAITDMIFSINLLVEVCTPHSVWHTQTHTVACSHAADNYFDLHPHPCRNTALVYNMAMLAFAFIMWITFRVNLCF